MPTALSNEQMITALQAAGESFKDCPVFKPGSTQAEEEIHKAMVNNWRAKLFLKWQTMQDLKKKKLPE